MLASQLQNGGGNGGNSGVASPGSSGSLSPNSAQQNQQLLSALHAMSKQGSGGNGSAPSAAGGDHFLNGMPVNNGPNLSSLLGLASPNMPPMSPADNTTNIPHGFYPSPMMLPGVNNCTNEDQWSSYKSSRNNQYGSNGHHKVKICPDVPIQNED